MATKGKYENPPHLELLNHKLVDVLHGDIKRLRIAMPPRHGKSMTASQYFPPWYLGNAPDKRIILCSYEASFAANWGRKARDVLEQVGREAFGLQVRQDSSAADRWEILGHTGGMVTAGVGGPITGRGADVLIIDDPFKNAEEAQSKVIRDKVWDWYRSTAYTRLEPGGAVILIMTRWHKDDLWGRLDAEFKEGGDEWTDLVFPAIATDKDVLGRVPGQALWPKRFPLDSLERIKATLGSYFWAAEYQQNPIAREDAKFRREWFPVVLGFITHARKVRYWDLAASKDGDYMAGALVAEHQGRGCVLDMRRSRGTPLEQENLILQTAIIDGPDVPIYFEQEPGSSGISYIDHLRRDILRGYAVHADKITGEKILRWDLLSASAEAGNFSILSAPWNADFLDEVEAAPNGEHDDQLDAVTGGWQKLVRSGGTEAYLGSFVR